MVWVVLIVLGLILGSFVNALVWRLHEQTVLGPIKGKTSAQRERLKQLSVLHGRSMCPHCGRELKAKDLIPVVSWAMLRGKCRYCGKSIGIQYPAVELLTAGLFVASYVFWPAGLHGYGRFEFILWLIFLVGFVALAVYDLRWFQLPTRIMRPLIGLAIVQVLAHSLVYHGGFRAATGALVGVGIGGGIFYVLFLVSRGSWIGGGDVRLGALLGLIVGGPLMSFLMLFGASLLGTAVSAPLLVMGRLKRTSRMPFGPFLLIAAILTQLFGTMIIHWYKRHLLGTSAGT